MASVRCVRLAALVAGSALAGACASGTAAGARPSPFPGAPAPAWAGTAGSATADVGLLPVEVRAVLDTALALRGVPYRFGGVDPATGVDCSGLVRYVFLQHRLELPRTAAEQFRVGVAVERERMTAGDLLFFSTVEPGPSHVGIALDHESFVHAPGTGAVVRVERFTTAYWERRLLGIRRVAAAHASSY
jgi:cell wall-associated NlpC family hydrolase